MEPLCDLMDKLAGVSLVSPRVNVHKSHKYLGKFARQIWGGVEENRAVLCQQYSTEFLPPPPPGDLACCSNVSEQPNRCTKSFRLQVHI